MYNYVRLSSTGLHYAYYACYLQATYVLQTLVCLELRILQEQVVGYHCYYMRPRAKSKVKW